MAQKMLDLDLHPRPTLWSDALEAAYGEALEASGVPARLRDAAAALEHVRDALLSPDGGDGVDLEVVESALREAL